MYEIEFYETEDGKCPIWDFLEALRLKAPTNKDARIQIAVAIYTQARLRTSLFCFLLYQLSLWWVKYRAQPEAIST